MNFFSLFSLKKNSVHSLQNSTLASSESVISSSSLATSQTPHGFQNHSQYRQSLFVSSFRSESQSQNLNSHQETSAQSSSVSLSSASVFASSASSSSVFMGNKSSKNATSSQQSSALSSKTQQQPRQQSSQSSLAMVQRTPAPPQKVGSSVGRLSVQTIPANTLVYANDRLLGQTGFDGSGAKVFELPPGNYQLVFKVSEAEDVKYQPLVRNVTIGTGETVSLGIIKLQALRKLRIFITGPNVMIRLNGREFAGGNTEHVLTLPEGTYELEARAANGKTLRRSIELRGDDFSVSTSLD